MSSTQGLSLTMGRSGCGLLLFDAILVQNLNLQKLNSKWQLGSDLITSTEELHNREREATPI